MAKFSLRRYEVQARVAVYLSIASAICLAGLALLVFRHPRAVIHDQMIIYNPKSMRVPLIYLFTVLSLGLGVAGFGFGWNSAGQRRNDKPTHSWIGFFIGAGTITFTLILFYVFWRWGEPLMVN